MTAQTFEYFIECKDYFENAIGDPTTPVSSILINLISLSRLRWGESTYNDLIHKFNSNTESPHNLFIKWAQTNGYITFLIRECWMAILDHDGRYIKAGLTFEKSGSTIYIGCTGDQEEIEKVKGWASDTFQDLGTMVETVTSINRTGFVGKEIDYVLDSTVNMAKDSFYPWLSISLDEYFTAFMRSKETVLVLFGPAGTGKSTFLRTFIHSKKRHPLLAYNREVVQSSRLVDHFYRSDCDTLVYEDVDRYLGEREEGNELMSTLLNGSDGVVQNPEKKIIFSTNLPTISKIDPALLRVGRCFDILHFRELSQAEAVVVAEDMRLEQRDFFSKEKWALTDILNERNRATQVVNRFGVPTGYGVKNVF